MHDGKMIDSQLCGVLSTSSILALEPMHGQSLRASGDSGQRQTGRSESPVNHTVSKHTCFRCVVASGLISSSCLSLDSVRY